MEMRKKLYPAFFLCGLGAFSTSGDRVLGAEPPSGDDWKATMKDLSVAFRGLEKSLSKSDILEASTYAEALQAHARRLASMDSSELPGRGGDASSFAGEVATLSQSIGSLSRAEPIFEAGRALEGVRRACVGCHVRRRPNNEEVGSFPAQGNTLHGLVTLLSNEGSERKDRSDVLVFLDGVERGRVSPLRPSRAVVSQKNRRFYPRVLPIVQGTTVEFPNDDTIFHNVFSLSKTRPFDLGIYDRGVSKKVTFKRSGIVRVFCNIHPDMVSTIVVLKNSHFTLTDSEGFYLLTGIPDGTYTLRTWSELGGETRSSISVSDSTHEEIPLEVNEVHRSLRHVNKYGKRYRSKY